MVSRHCSVPYRFVCVSDREIEGIVTVPASPPVRPWKHRGAWAKLDYFRREVSGDGPCLALDLDVTVVGDIAGLVSKEFSAAHTRHRMNSSIMTWTPNAVTDAIYRPENPSEEYPQGDQEYIVACMPEWLPLEGVYSYKLGLTEDTRRTLPEDAKIIFFHGRPTPATAEALQHAWNLDTWEGLEILERTEEGK